MKNVKVTQMTSNRTGGAVRNQFIIETDKGRYFQSYNSIIVFIPIGSFTKKQHENGDNKIHLDEKYWDYSRTTGKYRNQFLNETKTETQRKIDSGIYKLANLNQ